MASMLEMYQIAKDMADRESSNNMAASGAMSFLKGQEAGKAERKLAEDRRLSQAKMLLEMQAKMQEIEAQKQKQNRESYLAHTAGIEPLDQTNQGKLFRAISGDDINSPLSALVKELYPEMQQKETEYKPLAGDMAISEMEIGSSGTSAKLKRKSDIDLEEKKKQAEIENKKATAAYQSNRAKYYGSAKDPKATEAQLLTDKSRVKEHIRKLKADIAENEFLMEEADKAEAANDVAEAEADLQQINMRIDEFRKTNKIKTSATKAKDTGQGAEAWLKSTNRLVNPKNIELYNKLKADGKI